MATSRAGQHVHVTWTPAVEIIDLNGEVITTYPRPATTGMYHGPRNPQQSTPMKTTRQNPSAGINGTATRTVTKDGYLGALASKFYAGYKHRGEHVTISWDAITVTITDTQGHTIANYDKPTTHHS